MPDAPPKPAQPDSSLISYLSLFTSLGTLLCCALPSLFVLFGLGAAVATVLSDVPWLVTLSRHKNWVFLVSGLLIGANILWTRTATAKTTPPDSCDPNDPDSACSRATRLNRALLWISAGIYLTGAFTAYLLGPILIFFDS